MMCFASRRRFLKFSSGTAGAAVVWPLPALAQSKSPSQKLRIAVIGVAGRGAGNLAGVLAEEIVALCDVDQNKLDEAGAKKCPKARKFTDFRKMLDQIQREIEAVVVSTPDHSHAPAAAMAMRLGKHCYCEKPLTHNVAETRVLTGLAQEKKLATQLGKQIHAGSNYRRVVELVQCGVIGPIREVHVWINADFKGPPIPAYGKQPDAPRDTPPVPSGLDWDVWLGPAAYRPYHPAYVPGRWRNWWAFGNGTLGDFFCHYCDLAFWALQLRYPTAVEAEGPVHAESAARWTIARQEYAARGELPPLTLTWYNGGGYPARLKELGAPLWTNAVLFVGAEGQIIADYGRHELLPKAKFADFPRPAPMIPDSIGHHAEWIRACKTGSPTTCNFAYSGPLTEAGLLCNVALRAGKRLQWDAERLQAVGCPEADQYLRRCYRAGWAQ